MCTLTFYTTAIVLSTTMRFTKKFVSMHDSFKIKKQVPVLKTNNLRLWNSLNKNIPFEYTPIFLNSKKTLMVECQ